MANAEHVEIVLKGKDAFRDWRSKVAVYLNLIGADLIGADLSGTNLHDANLSRANLCGADLSGTNLHDANIRFANLSGANLSGANLSGADLSGADLRVADLRVADLHDANLSDADLSRADLSRANLSGANLSGTSLHDANLRDADLSGADLSGAYFHGADLTGATNRQNMGAESDREFFGRFELVQRAIDALDDPRKREHYTRKCPRALCYRLSRLLGNEDAEGYDYCSTLSVFLQSKTVQAVEPERLAQWIELIHFLLPILSRVRNKRRS